MTRLQPLPGNEKGRKGEKPPAPPGPAPFSPFSGFSFPGAAEEPAPASRPAAALAAVRAYRRTPPEPPCAPRHKPDATHAQAARARHLGPASATLPGVPLDWREGVALLATRPPPDGIMPRRWAAYAATAARLLHEHGAALHTAGWGTLDLFGLHPTAPMTHPPGWGLAWLLGEHGAVLDVSPDVIGMRREPNGARLALCWQRGARAGIVPAWTL